MKLKVSKKLYSTESSNGIFTREDWKVYYQLREVSKKLRMDTQKSAFFGSPSAASPNINVDIKLFRASLHADIRYLYTLEATNVRLHPNESVSGLRQQFTIVVPFKYHGNQRTIKRKYAKLHTEMSDVVYNLKSLKKSLKNEIKTVRTNRKQLHLTPRIATYNNRNQRYNLVFGVHETSDVFYNMMLTKRADKLFVDKFPVTNDNHVGIELEIFSKLDRQLLAVEFLKAKLEDKVRIREDHSIRPDPGYYANEVCVLTKESEYLQTIDQVCAVLQKAKARINSSCGLHVHIDMRNRNKDTVFNNLVTAQPLLYSMCPRSRHENKYCKKIQTDNFNEALDQGNTMGREARYFGINAQAYAKYRTIEIRIHSGTTNAVKIKNWVKLLLLVANRKEAVGGRKPRTFKTFLRTFDIDLDMATYIAERIQEFIDEQSEEKNDAA
jgi:hypothetical protein